MFQIRHLSPFERAQVSNSKICPETQEITKIHLKSIKNHYEIKDFNKSEIVAKLFPENTSPENKLLMKICKKLFSCAEYSENISAEKVKKLLDHVDGFQSLGVNNARIILAVAYSMADTINNNPCKEEILKHLHQITQQNLSSLNNVLTIDLTDVSAELVQDLFKKVQNAESDIQQVQIFHSEETSTMKQVAGTAIKIVLAGAGLLLGAKILGSLYQKLPSQNISTNFPTSIPQDFVPSTIPAPSPAIDLSSLPTLSPVIAPEPTSFIPSVPEPMVLTPEPIVFTPEPVPTESLIKVEEFVPAPQMPTPPQEPEPAPVVAEPEPVISPAPASPATPNNTEDSTENETETPATIEYEAPKPDPRAEARARKEKEQQDFTESRKPWEKIDSFATFLAAACIPAALLSNKISAFFAPTDTSGRNKQERKALSDKNKLKHAEKVEQKNWESWPAVGPVIGAMGGVAARLSADKNVHSLTKATFCDSSANKAFGLVNAFKQWEIKTFAPFTPAVLMAGNIGLNGIAATGSSIKAGSSKPLRKWLAEEAKNLPKKDVAIGVSLFTLSFFANIYQASVLPAGFDPSGHVMMKAATTYQMLTALQYLKNSGYSASGVDTIASLWALSEAYFMGNVTCHHSVSELIAGGFFASSLKVATDRAVNRATNRLANRA